MCVLIWMCVAMDVCKYDACMCVSMMCVCVRVNMDVCKYDACMCVSMMCVRVC
jgi:hypothetical protein